MGNIQDVQGNPGERDVAVYRQRAFEVDTSREVPEERTCARRHLKKAGRDAEVADEAKVDAFLTDYLNTASDCGSMDKEAACNAIPACSWSNEACGSRTTFGQMAYMLCARRSDKQVHRLLHNIFFGGLATDSEETRRVENLICSALLRGKHQRPGEVLSPEDVAVSTFMREIEGHALDDPVALRKIQTTLENAIRGHQEAAQTVTRVAEISATPSESTSTWTAIAAAGALALSAMVFAAIVHYVNQPVVEGGFIEYIAGGALIGGKRHRRRRAARRY